MEGFWRAVGSWSARPSNWQRPVLKRARPPLVSPARPQGGDSAPVTAKAASGSSSGSGLSFGLVLPLLLIIAAIVFQLYLKQK